MKLAFTSDLHVEYQMDVAGLVAEQVARLAPDVLVLAGDVCPELGRLEAALRLIAGAFQGELLFVPGNHDLWCGGSDGTGPDSQERYHVRIPRLVRRAGARPLGLEAVVVGEIGFAGVTGWYDYSLRDPELDASEADYRAKRFQDVHCVDGAQIHWPGAGGAPLTDDALCAHMRDLLQQQLNALEGSVSKIVVVTHMVPHGALLPPPPRGDDPLPADRTSEQRFLDAFMGSAGLGEEIARFPGVVRVISGHFHEARQVLLAGPCGPVTYTASPIGYPRELAGTLCEQVTSRLCLVDL